MRKRWWWLAVFVGLMAGYFLVAASRRAPTWADKIPMVRELRPDVDRIGYNAPPIYAAAYLKPPKHRYQRFSVNAEFYSLVIRFKLWMLLHTRYEQQWATENGTPVVTFMPYSARDTFIQLRQASKAGTAFIVLTTLKPDQWDRFLLWWDGVVKGKPKTTSPAPVKGTSRKLVPHNF